MTTACLAEQILGILAGINPELDYAASADFLADGMLDSFDMIMLVSELDKAYAIRIEGTDVLPEHFCNLAAICALLGKYGVTA